MSRVGHNRLDIAGQYSTAGTTGLLGLGRFPEFLVDKDNNLAARHRMARDYVSEELGFQMLSLQTMALSSSGNSSQTDNLRKWNIHHPGHVSGEWAGGCLEPNFANLMGYIRDQLPFAAVLMIFKYSIGALQFTLTKTKQG